jgi:hypothetical protein
MPQTGPKTAAGKKRSRANAVRHGLRAQWPVIRELEDAAEWKRHVEGVFASLEPDGYVEEEMAIRIAGLLWRLRRVGSYEAEQITLNLQEMPERIASSARYAEKVTGLTVEERYPLEHIDVLVGASQFPGALIIDNLMRYEAHLHRQYIQTLHELEAMQARRHGERPTLARLDITGSPS